MFCAVGSMDSTDWAKIKKLCSQLREEIDARFKALDEGALNKLNTQIDTLETTIASLQNALDNQNVRVGVLEETSANVEITTSELLNMYDKGDING